MLNLKKTKFIETENRLVVTRGRGWEWEKPMKVVKGTSFQLYDVMCNKTITVNNTILHI